MTSDYRVGVLYPADSMADRCLATQIFLPWQSGTEAVFLGRQRADSAGRLLPREAGPWVGHKLRNSATTLEFP